MDIKSHFQERNTRFVLIWKFDGYKNYPIKYHQYLNSIRNMLTRIIIFLFLNVSNHNNFISISRDSYWSWLLVLIIYVKIHVCLAGSTIAYRNVPQCYCLFMVKEMVSFKFVWESMWACSFVCLFQEFLAFLRKINFGRRKHYFKVSWLK